MNFFKKVFPKRKILYKTTSSISGNIEVQQIGSERRLVIDGFVQSINYDCKGIEKRVWGQLVQLISENRCFNFSFCLVLGCGGGTLIFLLKKEYPNLQIVGVEIDEKIIEIAKEYFGLSSEFAQIICADAYDVVKNPLKYNLSKKFDLVVVDVYCGGVFPSKFFSNTFMENLLGILNNPGMVIFNRILNIGEIPGVESYLKQFFSRVKVKKVGFFNSGGNTLFLCMR